MRYFARATVARDEHIVREYDTRRQAAKAAKELSKAHWIGVAVEVDEHGQDRRQWVFGVGHFNYFEDLRCDSGEKASGTNMKRILSKHLTGYSDKSTDTS